MEYHRGHIGLRCVACHKGGTWIPLPHLGADRRHVVPRVLGDLVACGQTGVVRTVIAERVQPLQIIGTFDLGHIIVGVTA